MLDTDIWDDIRPSHGHMMHLDFFSVVHFVVCIAATTKTEKKNVKGKLRSPDIHDIPYSNGQYLNFTWSDAEKCLMLFLLPIESFKQIRLTPSALPKMEAKKIAANDDLTMMLNVHAVAATTFVQTHFHSTIFLFRSSFAFVLLRSKDSRASIVRVRTVCCR